MNPHAAHPTTLSAMINSIWSNRSLIAQMSKREIVGRYRGSALGLLWSFLNPLLMLTVYTFFFAVVFKSKWGGLPSGTEETKTLFAVILFAGMIVHSLFSEVLNRAPTLVISNVNYVKKVIFPIEILPIINVVTATFHALISIFVLLSVYLFSNGFIHWTAVYLPIIFLPLIILTTGLAWMLASIGVFVRDVGQTIGILMSIMMFLSPVFYPTSALPAFLQPWIKLNPLTFIIEQARVILINGEMPNWINLFIYTIISILISWAGFFWFQKTRKGFADVL
jgi:lipopolysaccharide transport system permease protein